MTVWDRARALRERGLGPDRIWRTLYREGWYPLPTTKTLAIRMTNEAWPVLVRATNRRDAEAELSADERWRGSVKRCHVCRASGAGLACPNGHAFPVGLDTGRERVRIAQEIRG